MLSIAIANNNAMARALADKLTGSGGIAHAEDGLNLADAGFSDKTTVRRDEDGWYIYEDPVSGQRMDMPPGTFQGNENSSSGVN